MSELRAFNSVYCVKDRIKTNSSNIINFQLHAEFSIFIFNLFKFAHVQSIIILCALFCLLLLLLAYRENVVVFTLVFSLSISSCALSQRLNVVFAHCKSDNFFAPLVVIFDKLIITLTHSYSHSASHGQHALHASVYFSLVISVVDHALCDGSCIIFFGYDIFCIIFAFFCSRAFFVLNTFF